MKKKFLILILLSFSLPSLSHPDSIHFRAVKYPEVFELARKENKPILMYFHFDGCGACIQMEKNVFTDTNVIEFFNENFICYSVNTIKGDGIEINKIYKITLHPAFLFINPDSNIYHKMIGFFNADDFIKHGKNSLNPKQTLSYYKQQYAKGDRSADFLFNYTYILRDADELDSIVINEYLLTQTDEDLNEPQNIKYIYEFAIHNFKTNLNIRSNAYQFMLRTREKFESFFDSAQVITRIVWVAHSMAIHAAESQNQNLFDSALEILKDFDNSADLIYKEMDGRITGGIDINESIFKLKMYYYKNSDNEEKYNELEAEYIKKVWNDWESLNSFAWDYYEKYDDITKLEKAKKWVMRSIELSGRYLNYDTYASLLFKTGMYEESLIFAERAISIANKEELDYKPTTDLIEKINRKMNK